MQSAFDVLSKSASVGYLKVIKANLTRDTFELIRDDSSMVRSMAWECTTLSDYFECMVNGGYIFPDDIPDFRANTSLSYLRSFFRKNHGENIQWLNYRRNSGSGYRWAVMEIQSAVDYTDEEATVIIVVKDVQEAVSGQYSSMSGVLRALCGSYDSIYCVDLELEQVIPYRTYSHDIPTFDSYIHSNPNYQDLLERYIRMSVLPEDRSHVARITNLNFVRERLSARSSFSGEFRTVYNGRVHWYRIDFSKIEQSDSLRFVALGLSDISDEKSIGTESVRSSKNILVVSPASKVTASLGQILSGEYPVFTAAGREEAVETLTQRRESIGVVLADSSMDGFSDFVNLMRSEYDFRSIPLIALAEDETKAEEYLRLGASDILASPFRQAVVLQRIGMMISYRESSSMLNLLERDALTGLYSKEYFYRSVEQILREQPEKQHAILVSDIEHFHFYKERHGQQMADALLQRLARVVPGLLSGYVIGSRISDDVFAYLIRYTSDIGSEVDHLQRVFSSVSEELSQTAISVKCGLYVVDEDIPASAMCDRAVLAVQSIKGAYGTGLAEFDLPLREQLMKTQQILENAENAIEKEQFTIYYQPKHDIVHGGVCGAEALVRWVHPVMGFMSPAAFIPLFEKNGFIEALDRFILRRVCRDLVEWQENGDPVVPISVNVSRVDFDKQGLADRIIRLTDEFGLDHSLIHIEITESGYAEDPSGISREINKLHEEGFVIELDDFGTGYSSLSALSALPVDILKLDMSLLQQEEKVTSRNILEFSMQLAKIMKLETVQEGVETREQLERVSSMGCNQVQGFYFSRPLPKDRFIAYCRASQ